MAAMRRACEIAKELGAKRTMELPVSVSFHCSLLKGVQPLLARELENVLVTSVVLPVVANVSADYVCQPAEICDALVRQVSNAVMWQDSMERMISDGYRMFVEVGPGKSLSGLMRKISPTVSVHQVEDAKTLEKALKAFTKEEGA